jgi:hypothetical protein
MEFVGYTVLSFYGLTLVSMPWIAMRPGPVKIAAESLTEAARHRPTLAHESLTRSSCTFADQLQTACLAA